MRPGDEGFDERTASVAQSLQRDVAMPLMPSRASLVSIDLPDDSAAGVRSSLARSPSSTSGERDEGLWMADIKKEAMTPASAVESQSGWPLGDDIAIKEVLISVVIVQILNSYAQRLM